MLVKGEIRKSDVFARWGGEEFVLLLPATSLKYAERIAEKLREKIEQESFAQAGSVTCSFGVVELAQEEGESRFLQRADQLMYQAKRKGRNRVESGRHPGEGVGV